MALRIKRTSRSIRSKYTPSTRTTTRTKTGPGSYTTTQSVTPSSYESSQSGGIPYPTVTGASDTHAGIAILLATGLFLMATWKDVASPFINSAMNAKPYTGTSPKIILGGVLFIAIIGIIASTGPTGSSIMVWMLIAMWLLFIMFNGSNQVASFFGSLNPFNSNALTGGPGNTGGSVIPVNQVPPGFISNPGNTQSQGG